MIWKFLFFIYALIISLLSLFGNGITVATASVSISEAINVTCTEVILVLAMIYTFALGWKKRLISERFNGYFFKFAVAAFFVVGVYMYIQQYSPMYADMILQAMHNGMVPRHWDFQLLLALTRIEVFVFVLFVLFLIFAPFFLGYYHYTKQMTELGVAEHSGRKCFAAYVIFSYAFIFLSMSLGFSGEVFKFNFFDCMSLVSSFLIMLGLFGYAFGKEIFVQAFWRIALPVCVAIEVLPASFFTETFKETIGWTMTQSSPVYVLSSYLMTAVALVMIYRYATTDVVFKTENEQE